MDFDPGTGGSITATTLENQFFTLLSHIQSIEKDIANKNGGRFNIATSNISQDTGLCTGNCSIPCNIIQTASAPAVAYPDLYSATNWVEGDGDGSASNYSHALAQRSFWLANYERNSTYNANAIASKITGLQWVLLDTPIFAPIPYNATLNFNFSIETEVVTTGTGESRSAKTYLSGAMP